MLSESIEIYGNFKLKPPYKNKYPIFWIVSHKSKVAYGICGYKGKAFTMTSRNDYLTIGMVVDFFITDGECEEAKRCLCLDCKYNKTTIESFAKAKSISVKRLSKKWGKLVAKVNSVVVDINQLFQKSLHSPK